MADKKVRAETCANCVFGEVKEADTEARLRSLKAGAQPPPPMVECQRFPATVAIAISTQGPIVATSRPAMRLTEWCGEHRLPVGQLN